MILPIDEKIDVANLCVTLGSTAATYKFYWFLSIVEALEESGETIIKKDELIARMIANSWYPINYYNLSFGGNDKLQDKIKDLLVLENISIDSTESSIVKKLKQSNKKETKNILKHFDHNVPHKFLSPWVGSNVGKKDAQDNSVNNVSAPYILRREEIEVRNNWKEYLIVNARIIKDYCFWNLTLFLQSKNQSIPDIPSKLKRPIIRGSLASHKKQFWDIVIKELGTVKCIYSSKQIELGNYVIEHFIPHRFWPHDQMWNLIPADPVINSVKSHHLPRMKDYFSAFYDLQKKAIDIISHHDNRNKFLQHYLEIFPSLDISEKRYYDHMNPLITIARNNGFKYMDEK